MFRFLTRLLQARSSRSGENSKTLPEEDGGLSTPSQSSVDQLSIAIAGCFFFRSSSLLLEDDKNMLFRLEFFGVVLEIQVEGDASVSFLG